MPSGRFIVDMADTKREKLRIAYSGIEGAFAHIAAGRIFPGSERISYRSFRAAYEAVEKGDCDYAVLPVENSYAGEVGQVMDIIFEGELFVKAIYSLPVTQNLLAVKGASFDDIKKVISHPQALDQCYNYLQEHGYEAVQATNTAEAAKYVSELNDKSVAAIASVETAERYNLDILEENINTVDNNTTKFAVLEREMSEDIVDNGRPDVYAMMFTLPNEPGALSQILMTLGIFGYNMRVIRSRPLKGHRWTYYFYTEAEGDNTSIGRAMIEGMQRNCEMVKILGHYTEVDEL